MNVKVLLGTTALAALLMTGAASPSAQAQSDGPYLGVGIGPAFVEDSDIEGTGAASEPNVDFDIGWAGNIAAGYRFESGFRAEAEGGYHAADVDEVSGASGSGDADVWSVMGNLYYDFTLDADSTVRPYIGGGLGVAFVNFDGVSPVAGSVIDEMDPAFAFQAMAGTAVRVTDTVDVFGEYRYFAALNADMSIDSNVSTETDYREHRIMLGLRWWFGAPPAPPPMEEPKPMPVVAPPPPQPAPAPPPPPDVARTYLVFFDWDQSTLTPEGLEIVRTAAANFGKVPVVRLDATGHADRSGPDAYNMGLSQRRAESVRAELIRSGVPADQIDVFARGERDPLVPTPDGVREPQNRRVEIVFQ